MSRLLSINSYHYRRGGSDVVYLDHAALLEANGWKNAFFSMHHPNNIESEWSGYFVDELQYGHKYTIAQKLKMAAKVVYSLEARNKLLRLIDDFHPTIAHTHCIFHHLSPSILPALKQRGIPVVMTAHELKAICPAISMRNSGGICEKCKDGSFVNVLKYRCIKDSFAPSAIVAVETLVHRTLDTYRKNVDKLIPPSRFYRDKYIEWGWPEEKVIYIPNYVDAERLLPDYVPGNYFLYFGRLSVEKGVDTLIRAASAAHVPLRIAGTGPEENTLRILASSLGGQVDFLGYRSGEDLLNLVRQSKAVVLPSEWYENAPMTVLESYALGKPVIGARIGGIPELVLDGETGWSFASRDVRELTAVLEQADRTDSTELERIGRSARNFVSARFSRAGYLKQVLDVYAGLGVCA